MTNLAQNLLDPAREGPDRPALRMDDAEPGHGEFRDAALRVAAALEGRGVRPGDRVGLEARVPADEYQRHLWLVDTLPGRPTGKILRRAVEPQEVGTR